MGGTIPPHSLAAAWERGLNLLQLMNLWMDGDGNGSEAGAPLGRNLGSAVFVS